jgi:hypothetical protein
LIGTPLNLELLLHCCYSAAPHPQLHAPAVQEGIAYLTSAGMIEDLGHDDLYRATPKAEAYINYLMQVPFPEQHWIVPERTKIDG